MLRLNHIYLSVEDMERAIAFWESIFQAKIAARNRDRWANFEECGVYLGLYRPAYDGGKYSVGDNVTIVLETEDIATEHQRVKTITEKISNLLNAGPNYRYFHFRDLEGNLIEVAQQK
jgi:predicted enzyme related to lactoylglutathione lyase